MADQRSDKMKKCLPTFLVIGPGRSGTTWIYEALREHPDVCTARGIKETLFFDCEFHRGVEWYASFFDAGASCAAVGEISNAYIYNPLVPRRIKSVLPNVQLIACLRNPLERVESAYWFRRRKGVIATDFEYAVGVHHDLVCDSFYWTQLQWYLSVFEREQIHIMFYDDLKQNPRTFVRTLYDIIGVDPEFDPSIIDKKVNPGARVKSHSIGRLMGWIADSLRRCGLHSILDRLKRSATIQSFFLKELTDAEKITMPSRLRAELAAIFQPEVEGIARLTGRDLSHWLADARPPDEA